MPYMTHLIRMFSTYGHFDALPILGAMRSIQFMNVRTDMSAVDGQRCLRHTPVT